MPKTIIERIENIILEPFDEILPKHIKQFCAGRIIVTKKVVDNLKEAGDVILKEAKSKLYLKNDCQKERYFYTFKVM